MTITRLNPDTLHKNPAFTQVVIVNNPSRHVYVGGQNGVSPDRKVVGADIVSQSEEPYKNVIAALDAMRCSQADHLYCAGSLLARSFCRRTAFAGQKRLANPEFLIEIDAAVRQGT